MCDAPESVRQPRRESLTVLVRIRLPATPREGKCEPASRTVPIDPVAVRPLTVSGRWVVRTHDPASMEEGLFEVESSRDGNRAVLTARGEIDLATVDGLTDAFDAVVGSGANEVWLDLTEVGFMDSTGLSALVNGHRVLCGRLVVICPDGAPRRALEISGLGELIRVCSSLADAA